MIRRVIALALGLKLAASAAYSQTGDLAAVIAAAGLDRVSPRHGPAGCGEWQSGTAR